MIENRSSSTTDPDPWTTERLIDELVVHLASVKEYILDKLSGNVIEVKKYYRRARELLYRIPLWQPTPEFEVVESDLTEKLRKELQENTSNEWRQDVLKQAVERIFENVNFRYYHLSVARLLRVRLV